MLLLTEDDEEAAELSGQLEELNSVRRSEEKKIADSIAEQIAADPSLTCRRVLVFSGRATTPAWLASSAPGWWSGSASPA